jgi:hypothetical protein
MATSAEALAVARACSDLAKQAKGLKSLSAQVIANNSANEIDWGNVPSGTVTDGLVTGYSFTAAEVSNVLGSLDAFLTFMGTHGGNFEKLTNPIV